MTNSTNLPAWSLVAADFEPDGALRDIYVPGTTIADWRAVLNYLGIHRSPLQFEIDGVDAELPVRVEDVFVTEGKVIPTLRFKVSKVELQSHFFTDAEIEFDFWPDRLDSTEYESLARFLLELVDITNKRVLVCHENAPEIPILVADPQSRSIIFIPQDRAG